VFPERSLSDGDPVHIGLLGSFRVTVGETPVATDAWPARRAAELVQLLALARGHRLTRDQVIEALWPRLDPEAGGANLRKAAHYARKALSDPDAVVLRGGQVLLFPSRPVATDVDDFDARARAALADDDAKACAAATTVYGGALLPEALYEQWTQTPRERLQSRYLDLLRRSGQWELLVEAEPTDEPAYRALMRREMAAGSPPGAIRWYGRLRTALRRELGILPSAETAGLYDECVAGLAAAEPTFVGRQLERATIEAVLGAGPGAARCAVAVRGPGGIGKSAVCRELIRIAEAKGCTVIATTATDVGGPYAPLIHLAEQLVGDDPSLLDELGQPARAVLAKLTSAQPPSPAEGALTRHRVIGALRRLIFAAGRGQTVVVLVDDAHLADEATIDVLQHLTSPAGTPILIVLAYRAESAPHGLNRALARLARANRVAEIDLTPLNRDEAAALVAAAATTPRVSETVERIIELGQGNPFLLLELARSAVVGVPALVRTVRDAVLSRLLDLDEATVATLRRIALAGDDLGPASVIALAGRSEADAFALLDVALSSGVLIVAGVRYRFRHELVRQALIEQIPPHQRVTVHRDIAERLADADAEASLIGRHWLDGNRPSAASEWLLAAAREAMSLGAYTDALGHLAPLLEHDADHGEALRLRAEALDALGDGAAPAAYLDAARAIGEPGAQDLKAKGALAQIKLGDPPGGLRALEGLAPTTLDGRLAQALGFAGAAALGFGDPAIGTAKAAEARRLALRSGDPAAVAVASWAQAAAAHARGQLHESVLADLRETSALPQLAVSAFDGQLCITQRLLYGARPYTDVIAFADALEAEAKRLGTARGRAFAVTIRGEAKLLAGRLDEAEADLVEGADLHRRIGAGTGESFALQRRAEVALHRGRRAEALGLLDEALAIARESEVGFHLFDRIYGTRIVAATDPASAVAALEEAEEAVRGPVETCPGCRITLAVPAAIAAARAGEQARAERWASAAEFLANVVMRLPAWDAALEEVKGHRAQTTGELEMARRHFAAAATGFAACGQPLDEARCAALTSAPASGS
jgi:DNA-binding SARP family transcriptional activator